MRSKTWIGIGSLLFAVCFIIGGLHYLQNYDAAYYTKVDNTKIAALPADEDMKYEYTLDCYNQSGKRRKLKFKTSRELKEGAYLLLEVRAFGVHSWEEVFYDDLPQKVQEKIK